MKIGKTRNKTNTTMKKLILILAVVAMMLPSCKKINEALDSLDSRLDKLEQETIQSIDEQIAAINVSLDNLNAMDKELKGYIDGLTATATNLQEQINATNTKIDEVKAELKNDITTTEDGLRGEIETAKANVIAQLEAAKEELENELATINATIATLQAKDAELDGKIVNLQTYVDTELGKTTDWVNATFATLEQYNALVSEIATIKEQIKAINESISNLETHLTTKINEDIATAVSTLNADIQQKVKEITEAYSAAVKTAKEEITAAYTTAIQTAINALDASLKAWVGEQLANYYTIAEVEAKITALQTAIAEGDAALQEELNSLKSQLETTAAEITAAYKKAIEEAINTNNGVIDAKIANKIASVNQRINNEVTAINAKIAEIESRLDNVEAKIAELLARIQSVSYIPTYDDGKATVQHIGNLSLVTLDFEVSPKDAVVELAKVWQSAVSVKAVYTQTRAVSFIDMPIVEFESDAVNGIISITASGENLSQKFFDNTQEASCRLAISDGNSSIVSCYIPMVAQELFNVILYTSTDGAIVTPYKTDIFGANIVSNTYENGKGLIVFDGNITKIGNYAFNKCNSLKSIAIPDSITSIEDRAFSSCSALTSISIPNSVTSIGNYAFEGCSSLTSVTIPNSVTKIGTCAFRDCRSLTTFSGKFASADNCCLIVDGALNSFAIGCEVAEYTIPDYVTSIIAYAFHGCSSLTSVTIPECLTKIGNYAFNNCSSLKSVYCKPTLPPTIYSRTFYNNASKCKIYVPASSVDTYKTASYWNDLASNIVGENFKPANNEIWYTSSDDAPIAFDSIYIFGVAIVSNTYDNDKGIIVFNDDVTSIKMYAFNNCSSLTSVTIPNSVTSIEGGAFYGCSSLTSVTIPDSVTEIGSVAFEGCSSLKSVYCKPTTPPMLYMEEDAEGNQWYTQFPEGTNIYVPLPSVETYKHSSGWSEYNIIGF